MSSAVTSLRRIGWLLLGVLFAAGAAPAQTPALSFTSIPAMGTTNLLAGTAKNAAPASYCVLVYIYVQGWWIKPTDTAPQTAIQADGSWTCNITTGGADPYATQITAYLAPKSYAPPLLAGSATLPAELEANAVAKASVERTSPNAFHWCGYDWDVKNSGTFAFGPGPNFFSDSTQNAWVDANGKLHLRVTFRNGAWNCAEVISRKAFGYGTYRFFIDSVVDSLDPNIVIGLFTYDDDPTSTGGHREIDVEISRWANASDATNAQFVIQPYTISGNLIRWTIPANATPTTHSFTWSNHRVDFAAHNGVFAPPPASIPTLSTWTNTGASVPSPGNERVHLNLWLFNGSAPANGQEAEVVLSRFAFIPPAPAAPGVNSVLLDSTGTFHLHLKGDPQVWYRLETSANLKSWDLQPAMIAPESAFEWTDATAGQQAHKFYRASVVSGQ